MARTSTSPHSSVRNPDVPDAEPPPAKNPAAALLLVAAGLLIAAAGFAALKLLPSRDDALAMLNGCLTLGGALAISGGFAWRMPAHGIIGGGVVALLGTARGLANLPDLARFWIGDRSRGVAPLIEAGVTLTCLIILTQIFRWLLRERTRRMLTP